MRKGKTRQSWLVDTGKGNKAHRAIRAEITAGGAAGAWAAMGMVEGAATMLLPEA